MWLFSLKINAEKMKCEITTLVCLMVLGDGRYLNDDRETNASQIDFDLNGVLKENYNTKGDVEVYTPEDRFTDSTKTDSNEERKKKHEIEFAEGKRTLEASMVLRARPKKKMSATHVRFAEYQGYIDTKYEFAMVPEYMLYNGYISAKRESTVG